MVTDRIPTATTPSGSAVSVALSLGPNGRREEIATVTHEGQDFTAMGSCIDVQKGIIVAYVREGHAHLRGKYFDIVTFSGVHIAVLTKTGESRGFNGSRITHFGCEYAGFYWSGKTCLDWNQLLRLRRGRKL